MDYQFHYDHDRNTVVATIFGEWNAEGSNRAWQRSLELVRKHGATRLLTDHRQFSFRPPTLDIYERAERIVGLEEYKAIKRLAILVAENAHLPSYDFFVTVMRNRGIKVATFVEDEAAAWNWLTQS
ncbi:MAG: hypothetical protein QNJ40_18210 [Xanthomonadales bacterium]|nr:hypothetical protein [Xanthomonadales bacterium]